jgi:hypothetical protein
MQALINRVNQPAPKWFIKTKKAVSVLSNGIIIILLAMGYTDSSMVMLLLKVGVSTAMSTLEAILVDDGGDASNDAA